MQQKLKRSPLIYAISRNCTDLYIKTLHNIEVNGAEDIPETGSALITVKHQLKRDIPLEGYILKKHKGRYASWVMKHSLPKWLEKNGAIRFYREKEIRKELRQIKNNQKIRMLMLEDLPEEELEKLEQSKEELIEKLKQTNKQEKQEFKEKVKQTNEQATEYMKFIYQNNGLIVLHAEGTRNHGAMNKLNMSLINYTQKIKNDLQIKIPLILMGIEYENINKFRSKVIVNIKELDWNTPNLEQTISNELAELSGIN